MFMPRLTILEALDAIFQVIIDFIQGIKLTLND